MVKEFKEFIMRGNVLDMAVGIIIGVAFGKIVASLVTDLIMPPVGILVGGMDFSSLAVTLRAAAGDTPAVMLRYGMFIQQVIDFLIIAAAIFLLVKGANSMRRTQEFPPAAPPEPSQQEILLAEIRDLLKARG